MSDFEVVRSESRYEGAILSLRVDQVRFPRGTLAEREVVRHVPAVGVVPVTADREVVLVEQYRHPVGKAVLEIPAGLLFGDEKPEACAARELKEETGMTAGRLEKLAEFYTSPGFCDERVYVFLATGLAEGEMQPHEDEILTPVWLPLETAVEMALSGRIEDSKTLIGLLAAKFKMEE